MDVGPAFVSDGKPAEAIEIGQVALDAPLMAAERLFALNAEPGDARLIALNLFDAAGKSFVVVRYRNTPTITRSATLWRFTLAA